MNDTLRIDAYEAQVARIAARDRALLHELTVSVFWPHRDSDLDLLMQLGEGYIALDEIGRPLGSAMHFPTGEDFAMLGMMVTPPRLQARGGGRFLLQRIMKDCEGRDMRLNATRSGYRLYLNAGFRHVMTVYQHQGHVVRVPEVPPIPGLELTELSPEDHDTVREMDSTAYGLDRRAVIDALLGVSAGVVAWRAGRPCGFALRRRFGKGDLIGPLVADTEETAVQIVAQLLRQARGGFVRIDTPGENEALRGLVTAAGMRQFDTVTEMHLGANRRATEGLVYYGLAAHSLG